MGLVARHNYRSNASYQGNSLRLKRKGQECCIENIYNISQVCPASGSQAVETFGHDVYLLVPKQQVHITAIQR